MSRRKDPYANEFGVADDPFGGEPQRGFDPAVDSNPTRRQALDEMSRLAKLGELKPLNGRKAITEDWMTSDPVWQEFNGPPPKGPTLAEVNALHQEYGREIDRHLSQPQQQPREAMPKTAEETAELLFREFSAQYGELAKDANAVEAAARKVIEAGGFDFSRRADFYKRVAAELER